MPRKRLTDIAIRQLPTPDATTYWYDETLPAFGVRISPKGLKTFTVVHSKARTRTTLGHWPQTSLQDARAKARLILSSLSSEPQPKSITINDAVEEFLRTYAQPNYRPTTLKETDRLLRKYAPLSMPLSDLSPLNVQLPATPSEANHYFAVLRIFLNWCEQKSYIENSPLRKMKRPYRTVSRDRLLSTDEFLKIWAATARPTHYNMIVRLCFTTGQRRTALSTLHREWVHDDHILFPASTVKQGKEHYCPIGPLTKAVLAEYPYRENFSAWSQSKARLDMRSGVQNWVLHDARRFYSSMHVQLDPPTPIDIQEALLGHVTGSRSAIQRVYDRYERRDPMQTCQLRYENFLSGLLGT